MSRKQSWFMKSEYKQMTKMYEIHIYKEEKSSLGKKYVTKTTAVANEYFLKSYEWYSTRSSERDW